MNGYKDAGAREEMPAVRTTIVGGRPPGCGKGIGEIPRGIEVLIKKAKVDPAFRGLLLHKRAEAAREIGLTLDPAEATMLDGVPQGQLEAIIERTRVSPRLRKAFAGRAAAVMLAALGVATSSCDRGEPAGIQPDRPEGRGRGVAQPAQQPPAARFNRPGRVELTTGERADLPERPPAASEPGP